MGRWSQNDSDAHRLPEGFVRIAYDADTHQHTFRDTRSGKLYRSAPGEAYGTLHPVLDHLPSRPGAFAPEGSHHSHSHSRPAAPKTTFHDILPAHAITTSPTSTSAPKSGSRLLASANIHQRTQSTRVPSPPSQNNGSLHSRSKSTPNRPARDRSHHSVHSRYHVPHQQAHDTRSKSGFSFGSALRSLSRSLTTVRDRTRQGRSTDDDKSRGYRRL